MGPDVTTSWQYAARPDRVRSHTGNLSLSRRGGLWAILPIRMESMGFRLRRELVELAAAAHDRGANRGESLAQQGARGCRRRRHRIVGTPRRSAMQPKGLAFRIEMVDIDNQQSIKVDIMHMRKGGDSGSGMWLHRSTGLPLS